MNHFKSLITDLEVQKGTQKEVSLKGGFSRTLDIFLIKNKEQTENIGAEEWTYLRESFLLKLKKTSANIYPYIKSSGKDMQEKREMHNISLS